MTDSAERTPLLKVEHLSKEFPAEAGMFAKRFSKRVVSAVNDISFEIYPGETFGLVGESGCGKSTTGRSIMRLTKPTAGKVFFEGRDISEMNKHELKDMRREMQFIFQYLRVAQSSHDHRRDRFRADDHPQRGHEGRAHGDRA